MEHDEDVCEEVSDCVHVECAAVFGREHARDHGVTVAKVAHNVWPRSWLQIKKRREHVELARTNSTCRACGRKGHCGGRSVRGSATNPWSANWSRNATKADKDKTYGKKGMERARTIRRAQAETCLSRRAPFNRESRRAQPSSDRSDKSIEKVFSLFPWMILCQDTLLAGRTTQYSGEELRREA